MPLNPSADTPNPVITEKADPTASYSGQLDFFLSSLFLCAAAILLAIQDPIYFYFESRPLWTYIITGAFILFVAFAVFRRSLSLFFVGSVLLLLTITADVLSQPAQLSTPVSVVWPLRVGLVLLVALTWGFLLSPPTWLRRALIAFAAPSILALGLWGGPALAAQFLNTPVSSLTLNVAPYYMTFDSKGNLYATDINGDYIWVFDSKGSPQGTISPGKAPRAVSTPGPGIVPVGFQAEMGVMGLPVATPTAQAGSPASFTPKFEFCGLASDPQDNIYVVDLVSAGGYRLMRFNTAGDVTALWPVPTGYEPGSGCIAADDSYIYLSSRKNQIYVLNHEGKQQRLVNLSFPPLGITNGGKHEIMVAGPNLVARVNGDNGTSTELKVPDAAGPVQIPILVDQKGETLLTDHTTGHIVRLDLDKGTVLGTIGEFGKWPGQFGDVGGLAKDAQGRLYVSDYRHRVIQRFTVDGKIDAIWWATGENEQGGESD